MKTPKGLQALIDDGIVDEVIRPLKSGKEASVYLVSSGGQVRCAKVYKEANNRGFHRLAEYQEGGSRDSRAMGKRSKHGRAKQEIAWKNAEVDALYKLDGAGVRVPKPYGFFDGVLLMEVITDEQGNAAPRLNEVELSAEQAREWHAFLMRQIVLMLCAGLIHGDLSEYNVLVGSEGPIIIDLPQAIDAASNNNAFRMLERDVNNMATSFGRFAPELLTTDYAHEIWKLYQDGELHPDVSLTGVFQHDQTRADVGDILLHIDEARDEAERRERGRREAEAAQD
jgi:RIO kinase 1